jgi:Integrase core domain
VERSQKSDWEEFYSIVDLASPDLKEKLRQWQDDYNHERPHGSLGSQTPWEKWCDLECQTPIHEEVEALCDPTKEEGVRKFV